MRQNKLMAQEEDPFKVLKRIIDNACKLELLGDLHVSVTFNVGELAPYVKDNLEDLRENPSQEGEVDANTNAYKLQANFPWSRWSPL